MKNRERLAWPLYWRSARSLNSNSEPKRCPLHPNIALHEGLRSNFKHILRYTIRVTNAFKLSTHEGLAVGRVFAPERKRPRQPRCNLVVGLVDAENYVPHKLVPGAVGSMKGLRGWSANEG